MKKNWKGSKDAFNIIHFSGKDVSQISLKA